MSLAMNHAKEIGKKEAMDFLKSHKNYGGSITNSPSGVNSYCINPGISLLPLPFS